MIIKDQPKFDSREKLFDWLADNCDDLIYEAKSQVKHADALIIPMTEISHKNATSKAETMEPGTPGLIKARLVINTTNLMDSHKDVHIPGLWDKSLKENKRIKHKQEHGSRFKDIISDGEDLNAFAKTYEWKELGYDIEGKTQALVFDSNIKASRNIEMFNEYKNGNVDNHSVGMVYVKIIMSMNSDKPEHAAFKSNWEKYYPEVANKAEADKHGYFFPVLEAKAREGSAVPDGSNWITPTLSRKTHSTVEQASAAKALEHEELKTFINNLNI